MLKWLIGGFVVLMVFFASVAQVGAGEQGVVTRFGAIQPVTLEPGLHVVIPLVDTVHIFDVKEQKQQADSNSASRDLQSVRTTIALNYHLDPNKVNNLYQEVGRDYRERLIDPAIQESVKAATAQFSAEELITKRSEVREKVRTALSEKLSRRYISLDDVSIVDFGFSEEFDKSIEAKQVAEQQALKAEQDLKRIEVEAKQSIERAKAEAEALRLQKENATDQLVRLREVEVQLKMAEKWDGKLPQYTGGAVPFFDLGVK